MIFELFYGTIGFALLLLGFAVANDFAYGNYNGRFVFVRTIGFICGIVLAIFGCILISLTIAYWIQT